MAGLRFILILFLCRTVTGHEMYFCAVNVRKWEETVAEDEQELEKLKKDENKQMKVCCRAPFICCLFL
jgi:hypothetical protein